MIIVHIEGDYAFEDEAVIPDDLEEVKVTDLEELKVDIEV